MSANVDESNARDNLGIVVRAHAHTRRTPDMVALLGNAIIANTQATLAVVEEIRALREEIKR